MPLINCEIELNLTCSKYYIISEISRTPEVGGGNPAHATLTTREKFQMNNAKLYVQIFILSTNDNIKFLENIKQGLKRKISWNKYRSKILTQSENNNLDYLINQHLRTGRLFVRSFKNSDDDHNFFYFFLMSITCYL